MNELIAVTPRMMGEHETSTVNARELYRFLSAKKDFSSWIKKQIERARLIEDRDFLTVTLKGEGGNIGLGGRFDAKEYFLTLDAGKHIAMLSGTEKGFEVREYFIECERQVQIPKSLPQNYKEALLQLVDQVEANEKLQRTIDKQSVTVKAYDRITLADGLLNITSAAKTLQINPNQRLFSFMSANGWIYRRIGGKGWVAYQGRIACGYLTHKVTTVQTSDGRERIVEQVLVTPKGLAKLAKHFTTDAMA